MSRVRCKRCRKACSGSAQYCSPECREKKLLTLECTICGKEFQTRYTGAKVCGMKCRRKRDRRLLAMKPMVSRPAKGGLREPNYSTENAQTNDGGFSLWSG